jgi:hypothetical protein
LVHSLFKEYITCARSFSLLLLPAPLSLCRLARKRPKTLLQLLLLKLLPKLLRTLLLSLPMLLPLQPTQLLSLPTLLPTLLLLLPMPLLLLRMLPRRCNLRRRAQDWARKGNLARLFFCADEAGYAFKDQVRIGSHEDTKMSRVRRSLPKAQ